MRIVTYKGDSFDLDLHVKQAIVLDRLRRQALQREAGARFPDYKDMTPDQRNEYHFAVDIYSACIVATASIECRKGELSLELSSDDFLRLPDALMTVWLEAVIEENPQFFPFLRTLPTSPSESEDSSESMTS